MRTDLDTYLITIDEEYSDGIKELGIEQIAFVNNPAIMVKGMAFSNEIKQLYFNDDVKMRVAAPALIPMTIYRYDKEIDYEYNVQFTAEVIEQMYKKFMSTLSNSNSVFNLEHNQANTVPAYVLESILVDSEPKIKMIKDEYGIDIPLGSVFIVSQITDREYYEDLVKNERFAYSIEGYLGMDFLETKLTEMRDNKNKNNEIKMEENILKLPAGEHTIGDKIYVVDETGNIVEIKDVVAASEETPAEEVKPQTEETTLETVETPAEEVKPEEVPVDEPTKMAIDETELMTILQPKFDEIYAMIAEIKAGLATKEDEDVLPETPAMEMSAIEKRLNFAKSFIK